MLKLDHKVHVLIVVAASALASASPVLALDDAKPSKPLRLLSFVRASRAAGAQKTRPLVAPLPADVSALRSGGGSLGSQRQRPGHFEGPGRQGQGPRALDRGAAGEQVRLIHDTSP